MDSNDTVDPIVHPSVDVTTVDTTTPVIYASVHHRGEKGEPGKEGSRGPVGPVGPVGPAGKDAQTLLSMSQVVGGLSIPHPISFYFPIENGLYSPRATVTNSSDPHLVDRTGPLSVYFNFKGFVQINVKITTLEKRHILLIKEYDTMVDHGYGPCINLTWTGPIQVGNSFLLSGVNDRHLNGYWHITML
jgi:hypothetical protein